MDGLEQGGGGDHVGPQRPPIHPSNRDSPATPLLPQRLCPGPSAALPRARNLRGSRQHGPVLPRAHLSNRPSVLREPRVLSGCAQAPPTSRNQCGSPWGAPSAGGHLPAGRGGGGEAHGEPLALGGVCRPGGGHVGRRTDGHEPRRPSQPKAGPEGTGLRRRAHTPRPPSTHGLPLRGFQILHGSLGPDEGAGHPHEAFPACGHDAPGLAG